MLAESDICHRNNMLEVLLICHHPTPTCSNMRYAPLFILMLMPHELVASRSLILTIDVSYSSQ